MMGKVLEDSYCTHSFYRGEGAAPRAYALLRLLNPGTHMPPGTKSCPRLKAILCSLLPSCPSIPKETHQYGKLLLPRQQQSIANSTPATASSERL